MMHGDSRVMVVVCLETASLPAPCLSTSTSPRSREEPHFQPSLVFARLDSRQIFRLTNPQLPDESTDYRSYLYDPMRDDFGIAP